MKKIFLLLLGCLLSLPSAHAQSTIVLKNGKEVEGKMIEKTDEYIKMSLNGIEIVYWIDEIVSIKTENIDTKTLSENKSSSEVTPTLKLSDKDIADIKRTVETYLSSFCNQDLDSMMSLISVNYYEQANDGTTLDYDAFESRLKRYAEQYFKIYSNDSFSNLQIVNAYTQGVKTIVTTRWDWKKYNTTTLEWKKEENKQMFIFIKENSSWIITHWEILEKEEDFL